MSYVVLSYNPLHTRQMLMFISDPVITAVILVFLLSAFLMDTLADVLNISHLNPVLPAPLSDVYEADRYAASQDYLKTTTWFGRITATIDLAALVLFWFMHGFAVLDTFARGLSPYPILRGLIFTGALMGLKWLLSLPFSIWRTFVIEERFGFNRTSLRTFVTDLIKTAVVSLALGIPLLSLIFFILGYGGPFAWALCWGAVSLFIPAVHYIVPTWIMPLFNTFTPLEEGELKTRILEYARSIRFPLTHIFVMDGSRRSAKSNAFFTGFGKNKRIVLYDTLIKAHTHDELLAVLAHEMGHYKKRHILRRMILSIAQMGLLFFLLSLFISEPVLFKAFFVDQVSVYAGLIFFGIIFSPVDMLLSVAVHYFSRQDEYAADRFAADTTGKPAALVSALKKLSARNLANLTPHWFYVFLNYSHPPLLERISALNAAVDGPEPTHHG